MNTWSKLVLCVVLPPAVFIRGARAMNLLVQRQAIFTLLQQQPCRQPLQNVCPEKKPLGQRFGYSFPAFASYLKLLEQHLEVERNSLRLDLLFPFFYGTALATALFWLWHQLGKPFFPALIRVLLGTVACGMVADWTENLTQLHEIGAYVRNGAPALSPSWVLAASTATRVKLSALFLGAGAWLVMGLLEAASLLRDR